jgi:hypothetical protein
MLERIDGRPYRSPWGNLLAAPTPAPDGGYFLSHDRRLLYVVIDLVEVPRTFAAEQAVWKSAPCHPIAAGRPRRQPSRG